MCIQMSKNRKLLVASFLVATILSIIGGGQRFLIRELHQAGEAPRFAPIIFEFSYWYVWVGLILPVFWLTLRLPVGRERWGKNLAAQAALSVLFAFLHLVFHTLFLSFVLPDTSFAQVFQSNLIAKVFQRVLVYSAFVVACYVYSFHLRYRQEAKRGLQLESQLALTQLQGLKNQLNPSIIFSVLNSIRLFLRSNVEVADTLTARLGDYLRLSLESSGQQMVPLQQELEMVGAYVEMEEIRQGRKIPFQMIVHPDVEDVSVPNSVLPLIVGALFTEDQEEQLSGSIALQCQLDRNRRLKLTVRTQTNLPGSGLPQVLPSLKRRLEEAYESGFECTWGRESSRGEWISLTLPLTLSPNDLPASSREEDELLPSGLGRLQEDIETRERQISHMRSGFLRKAATVFGIWTVVALVQYLQGIVTLSLEGNEIDLFRMALDYAAWYSWALATPLILFFARVFPLDGKTRSRNLFIHFGLSICISICMVFLYAGWCRWMNLLTETEEAQLFVQYSYVIDMLVYFAILGIREAILYSDKILKGELHSARLKANLVQAQLQALKMQLHPHFLFNTLNSLSELMHEDAPSAEVMLDRLKDFLKMTMEADGAQEIPLEKELEFLRDYLAIQQMRFQDRLEVDFQIDPGTVSYRVPNLILQPIVENAIRHGIASRPEAGKIEIRTSHEKGNLCLRIMDDGPGMSENSIESIPVREGVGLSNTRARLAQLYGESHSFDMTNGPLGGLLVTVQIPLVSSGRELK